MNVRAHNVTRSEAVERIAELAENGRGHCVVTPNVDHIVKLEREAQFRKIYAEADLVLCDSQILMWLSKWNGTPLKEKVSGSDLLRPVCGMAAERNRTVFFLGSTDEVLQKAAESLRRSFPALSIAGMYAPPFGFEKSETEVQKAISVVSRAAPDILVLCLGTPKQEKFFHENRGRLGAGVALCVGASLDFEAGKKRRAPKWVSRCGMEWFFRFLIEPRRLFKRYFVDDIKVFPLAWKYRSRRNENRD